jgi:hypothetical protein
MPDRTVSAPRSDRKRQHPTGGQLRCCAGARLPTVRVVSIDEAVEGSPAMRDARAHLKQRDRSLPRRPRSQRWAVVRLVALWMPIAAVLALALWSVLFMTLDPWGYRWQDQNAPELDALPSQLLFALVLLVAGRFETMPWNEAEGSKRWARDYWTRTAVLIGVGCTMLWLAALGQPVLQ